MKGTFLKIVAMAVIVMSLVVPVSAKTAGQPGAPVPGGSPAVPAEFPLVDWYENWDTYPTGQNMHGLGGWKGWFNDPNGTAYTSDAQRISLPNSIDIHGASDLVHEYAIDDRVWTYTAWQFVPTNFAGTTYFILLNQYDDQGVNLNWSLEVSFDSATGLVTNDGPVGGTLPLIKGQWVEIRAEIDLVADWQQVYYGGDLLFEGSWSDGMSGDGITSIGAVDLYANSASPVYYDDLSLVEVVENTMVAKVRLSGKVLGGLYVVSAIVRVRDAAGNMIEGADVTAFLKKPNGNTNTDTRTTNAYGRAAFPMASPIGGYWLACIEDVQHPDYVWDDSGPKCDFLEFPTP